MDQNIKLKISRKNNQYEYNKIYILTYYKKNDTHIINLIQKKCFIENSNNKFIEEVHILGENLLQELKEITHIKNIVLHETSSSSNLTYYDLLSYSNSLFSNNIVCILRSDIILPNQPDLEPIQINLLHEKNEIYCLSRIEHLMNGTLMKYDKLNRIFYATEQDAWIFKNPININDIGLESLKSIFFYNKYSELQFNYILKNNNCNLINDTRKYKILRILHENNLESRLLLNDTNIKVEEMKNIYILPDNDSFHKLSIQDLVKSLEIDEKELYFIKCELFNIGR